jgi:hypothetical protein
MILRRMIGSAAPATQLPLDAAQCGRHPSNAKALQVLTQFSFASGISALAAGQTATAEEWSIAAKPWHHFCPWLVQDQPARIC